MNGFKTLLPKQVSYSILKDYSSPKEKDGLILNILNDSVDYVDKEQQVNNAYEKWLKIQERKIVGRLPVEQSYLNLASNIKNINKSEISVGIRDLSYKYEYWIICKHKDYDILDEIYDLYQNFIELLSKPIDFIFVGEQQFIGDGNIVFLTRI